MVRFIEGDALAVLKGLRGGSIQTCVTSPPYWGLRDYGVSGQLGLEDSPTEYIEKIVQIFREVRRVLRKDGTLWLNLGDCYATSGGTGFQGKHGDRATRTHTQRNLKGRSAIHGLKPKDLVGIPWRVALALQADGWYLRMDVIWHKPNPMPESVRDRPTKAHEYLFLLSKSPKYYYDAEAVEEPASPNTHARYAYGFNSPKNQKKRDQGLRTAFIQPGVGPKAKANAAGSRQNASFAAAVAGPVTKRNRRSVWTVVPQPYRGAHFATFPPDLIRPCVLAGAPPGGLVLDPFSGAGTTALVAKETGRKCIGIELNPEYIELARDRLRTTWTK